MSQVDLVMRRARVGLVSGEDFFQNFYIFMFVIVYIIRLLTIIIVFIIMNFGLLLM